MIECEFCIYLLKPPKAINCASNYQKETIARKTVQETAGFDLWGLASIFQFFIFVGITQNARTLDQLGRVPKYVGC